MLKLKPRVANRSEKDHTGIEKHHWNCNFSIIYLTASLATYDLNDLLSYHLVTLWGE